MSHDKKKGIFFCRVELHCGPRGYVHRSHSYFSFYFFYVTPCLGKLNSQQKTKQNYYYHLEGCNQLLTGGGRGGDNPTQKKKSATSATGY